MTYCGHTWPITGATTGPPFHTCWRNPDHNGPHWCCNDEDEDDRYYPGGNPDGIEMSNVIAEIERGGR